MSNRGGLSMVDFVLIVFTICFAATQLHKHLDRVEERLDRIEHPDAGTCP